MPKWYKTLPRDWERPDVPLNLIKNFEPPQVWPTFDRNTIYDGDIVRIPKYDLACVIDVDATTVTVHPRFGPTHGIFPLADVLTWRNATWDDWRDKNVTPSDLAKAMFPENWR